MKTFLSLTLLILMSSTLVSCGEGKTTAKLEITRAFAVNGGQFDGGLIVHGFSSAGKKVTLSIVGSYQKSFSLDADTWTFYAVGWDGATKFAGNPYCGQSLPQDISANATVAITVSTANCNAAFNTTVGLRDTRAIACSTFYKYSLGTDTWTEITNADANNICTTGIVGTNRAPLGFGTDDYNYKVVAVDNIDGVSTPVFESPCFDADGIDGARLPNKLFPFVIKGYPSYNDCINNTAKFQSFTFSQGLETSGPDFKHLNQLIGATSRLVLPSSITRTGYSTFTQQIPSILCGTPGAYTECNTDVNDGVDVYVPWSNESSDRTIKRKTALTSCPASLLDSSPKFGLIPGSCTINDKSIRAKVHKNSLVCQDAAGIDNVIAMDRVNDKIFILRDVGAAVDTIEIYNHKGLMLGSFTTATDGNTLMAASESTTPGLFNIVTYSPTGNLGRAYTWSAGAGAGIPGIITFPPSVGSIELDEDTIIYSVNSDIGLRSFSNSVISIVTNYGETFPITQLRVLDGRIYFVENGSIRYKAWDVATSTISAGGSLSGFTSVLAVSETPTPTIYYVDGSDILRALAPDNTVIATLLSNIYVSITDLEVKDGIVLKVASGILEVADKAAGSVISQTSGFCNDTITVDGQALVFDSRPNQQYELHENSMRLIGRKYSADPNRLANAFKDIGDNNDDGYSSGGALRRVQEHLSAKGLGGVFPQFTDCNTLKNSPLLPLTGGKSLYDYEENKTFNIVYTVSTSTTDLPLFTCMDSVPSGAGCGTPKYDLDINYTVSKNGVTDERGLLRLSCSSKRGTFETVEIDGTKTSRELIVWNTQDSEKARLENFEYYKNGLTELYSTITKIQKSGLNDFVARQVFASENGSGIHVGVNELQRAGSTIKFKHDNISPPDFSDSLLTNATATGFASMPVTSSLNNITDSVFAAQVGGIMGGSGFTQTQTENSAAFTLPMSMAAFENLDDPSNDVLSFFTLTP